MHEFAKTVLDEKMLRKVGDLGLVDDALRPLAEAQRRQRLEGVLRRRAAGDDQRRLRVAAERVLQQPRQLGVAERDVLALPFAAMAAERERAEKALAAERDARSKSEAAAREAAERELKAQSDLEAYKFWSDLAWL